MTVNLNVAWSRGTSAIQHRTLERAGNQVFSLFGYQYTVFATAGGMTSVQFSGGPHMEKVPAVRLEEGIEGKIGDICFTLRDRKVDMRIDRHVIRPGRRFSFELGVNESVVLRFPGGGNWRLTDEGKTGRLFVEKLTERLGDQAIYFYLSPGNTPTKIDHFEISTDGKMIEVNPLPVKNKESTIVRWARYLLGLDGE